MCDLPSSYKEDNRVYWKISECLPVGKEKVKREFQLHNKSWQYMAYYYESYKKLLIEINAISPCVSSSYKVRGGIIGDSQKEIFSICAIHNPAKSNFQFLATLFLLKINLHRKINKVLYIFIEMKEVNRLGMEIIKPYKLGNSKIDYKNLLLSGSDSDLTIEVKDKKFKCHKAILRARSPAFSAMLEHDMKKENNGIVKIIDTEPTVFEEFLLYLYAGNSDYLNWKNVTDLYKLGDKYIIEDLKSSCVEQINRNITTENFSELFLFAQQYNDSELFQTTVHFFLQNSKEIVDNENWFTFLSKNLVQCNVLIKALAACNKNMYALTPDFFQMLQQ